MRSAWQDGAVTARAPSLAVCLSAAQSEAPSLSTSRLKKILNIQDAHVKSSSDAVASPVAEVTCTR